MGVVIEDDATLAFVKSNLAADGFNVVYAKSNTDSSVCVSQEDPLHDLLASGPAVDRKYQKDHPEMPAADVWLIDVVDPDWSRLAEPQKFGQRRLALTSISRKSDRWTYSIEKPFAYPQLRDLIDKLGKVAKEDYKYVQRLASVCPKCSKALGMTNLGDGDYIDGCAARLKSRQTDLMPDTLCCSSAEWRSGWKYADEIISTMDTNTSAGFALCCLTDRREKAYEIARYETFEAFDKWINDSIANSFNPLPFQTDSKKIYDFVLKDLNHNDYEIKDLRNHFNEFYGMWLKTANKEQGET